MQKLVTSIYSYTSNYIIFIFKREDSLSLLEGKRPEREIYLIFLNEIKKLKFMNHIIKK